MHEANLHLDEAEHIADRNPGSCKPDQISDEIDGTRKMLKGTTFYLPVTTEETLQVLKAMSSQATGTGRWYTCVNGR